ncbi:cobalt/nickel transport system ATP-binding protein [Tumebacillus sp. BK434]|uniref:energy-coupling factor ABC transporter ATP-binding protein n=1 Tax=Tumebacillus sp. BK434 TaxID=2512169 RepID=UPI001045442F|nr:ABC transporter ATP-binding protein [Tumebacillus sp. BK434]TCP52620.1 cobalt/nickel transport system ATP-binding protein [Tumebacillus sp. BK434]
MSTLLETKDLRYTYPGTRQPALRDLSISIPAGKKTVICGQNGSGKSSFFLQAIGIARPQSGEVRWNGAPLSYRSKDLQQLRQEIGLVFQDPEQQLILNTPYEDISYGLRNAKLPEREIAARTEAILQQLQLLPLADTPLHHLSLGQKKRVALAGVLALEPRLVLLDEPTAYLDRRSEEQLLAELHRIHRRGITTVMATHDMNLAFSFADWVLVFDQGACVMAGTPEEVFAQAARIAEYGMDLPILYDLWSSLPTAVRQQHPPPRDTAAFKKLLQNM